MVESETKFLSIKEFAAKLGVHHHTVRRAIIAGNVIAIRIGTTYRIPFAEIERILDESLEDKINKIIEKRSSSC